MRLTQQEFCDSGRERRGLANRTIAESREFENSSNAPHFATRPGGWRDSAHLAARLLIRGGLQFEDLFASGKPAN
jgi:hypothetical protein